MVEMPNSDKFNKVCPFKFIAYMANESGPMFSIENEHTRKSLKCEGEECMMWEYTERGIQFDGWGHCGLCGGRPHE